MQNETYLAGTRGSRQLLPCPFCGGPAELEKKGRAFVNDEMLRCCFVRCIRCRAITKRFSIRDFPTNIEAYDAAVNAWNRRV